MTDRTAIPNLRDRDAPGSAGADFARPFYDLKLVLLAVAVWETAADRNGADNA